MFPLKPENVNQMAEIIIRTWRIKLSQKNLNKTNNLFNSFKYHVNYQAGGDLSSIDIEFATYGKFVDMNVSRQGYINNVTKNKRRQWFSPTKYAQVKRIAEIVAAAYGKQSMEIIAFEISK